MPGSAFTPVGLSFAWQPDVLFLQVAAEAAIAFACFCISAILVWIVRRRPDFPFTELLWLLAAFIVASGVTQVAAIVIIWHPLYWLDGLLKAIAAALSLATVIVIVRLLPRVLAIRSAVELERLNLVLERNSVTDVLTGLVNRRGFDVRMNEALADCRRHSRPASLMMIDIDNFKALSDAYGHPVAETCLRMTADVIKRTFTRPRDLVARFSDEEFAVLMEDTDAPGALLMAERVRKRVAEQKRTPIGDAKHPAVTVSVGTTTALVPRHLTSEHILFQAGRALHEAKVSGCNRVVVQLA
jgi:diguanylate cyclase (GGDEF)-like protein